ncbi:SET domain-containing protein [Xylariaceae sp. FL0016]|nr:SET domain-containing protein [Xylariaceae sp. FL0016]
MFNIRHAGIKGFGIFASRRIPRGSRILAERALISINDTKNNILAAVAELRPADQKTLLGLSLNETRRSSPMNLLSAAWQCFPSHMREIPRSRDILNIFYNNNFALTDGPGTRAVFPSVARINHSCVPNSQGNFNANLGSFTVHATRDIALGEEVTISYLRHELGLRAARQGSLHEGYGFHCACELCSGSVQRRRDSNDRRRDTGARLKTFAEARHPSGDNKTLRLQLELTRLVIDVHEQEGLAGRELASLYTAAAGMAARLDDLRLANTLGARGLKLEKDAVGTDSPFYEATLLAFSRMSFEDDMTKFTPTDDTGLELSYAPWT